MTQNRELRLLPLEMCQWKSLFQSYLILWTRYMHIGLFNFLHAFKGLQFERLNMKESIWKCTVDYHSTSHANLHKSSKRALISAKESFSTQRLQASIKYQILFMLHWEWKLQFIREIENWLLIKHGAQYTPEMEENFWDWNPQLVSEIVHWAA